VASFCGQGNSCFVCSSRCGPYCEFVLFAQKVSGCGVTIEMKFCNVLKNI
jgi:hypothetical protein